MCAAPTIMAYGAFQIYPFFVGCILFFSSFLSKPIEMANIGHINFSPCDHQKKTKQK